LVVLLLAGCGTAPARQDDGEAAVDLVREMLRRDTINPPQPGSRKANANETELLTWIRGILERAGIPCEIVESAPGRGNLVARFRGAGAKKPLLLLAHVDVVNVDRRLWDVDPLSGELRGGALWGRGALDDKGWAGVAVQVMVMLARNSPTLSRDVVLMLNADEESGGKFGAAFMVEKHWAKIECGVALNEGGRTALGADGKIVQIQVQPAEKVYNDFRLWVPGTSGHSSVPRVPNAVYETAKILAKLESFETPIRVTPTMAAHFEAAAELPENSARREWMKSAAKGDSEAAAKLAASRPDFNALLRTTVVPTTVQGGIRVNVLPPSAEVNFNARLLPGEKLRDLLAAMSRHLGWENPTMLEAKGFETWLSTKPTVPAWIIDLEDVDAPASPVENEAVEAIRAVSKRLAPGAPVVPILLTGATDSRFLRQKGVPVYGIHPCPTTEEERATVHNHNERVRVSSVKWGVTWLHEIVLEISR